MNSIQHIAGGKKKALLGVSEEKKKLQHCFLFLGLFWALYQKGRQTFYEHKYEYFRLNRNTFKALFFGSVFS